jgi:hypothetical protein
VVAAGLRHFLISAMALISQIVPGAEWYQVVQQLYSTPHLDTPAERAAAMQVLDEVQQEGELTLDEFRQKINLISRQHKEHRYKLATLINSRFWEQRLTSGSIQARAYTPPGPWQGSSSDPMKP